MKINKLHLGIATLVFFAIGYFTSSSTIEIISAISGLLCVWLAAKENIWNYPVGFVNIGAFMYIFYDAKLYADFMLQIVFAALGIYGWIYWLTNKGDKPVRETTRVNLNEWVATGIFLVLGTYFWGYILTNYTDASIPYLDACLAVASIIAQIMLSSKRLENWYMWIAIDVVSIGMYWYKDLHIVSALYVFFLINAIYGAIGWNKEYKKGVA